MDARERIKRAAGALAAMVLGTAGVVGLVMAMNASQPLQKARPTSKVVAFEVQKKRPPKVKPKTARPRPRPLQRRAPRAPLPVLGVGLSGVEFGIPGVGDEALAGLSEGLLGGGREALDSMVMTEKAVDVKPKPLTRVDPVYPARARARGITGHVVFKLLIGDDGAVEELKVEEAQPEGVFEEVAEQAVRRWRFSPGTYRGKAVRLWSRLKVNFQLG